MRRVTRPTSALDVLADEYEQIHGRSVGRPSTPQDFFGACHRGPPRTALCLSGGGIRSAAFALGIVQWLAGRGLLDRFQYLSTVSGGGYTGAWLSAWIHGEAEGYATVRGELAGRHASGREAPEVSRLRENSQYLTPRSGIASGDTWAAVAITIRNLALNWLVVVPVIAAVCLLPQAAAAAYEVASSLGHGSRAAAAAAAFYLVAMTYVTLSRARWKLLNLGGAAFGWLCCLPGMLAAVLWSVEVASLPGHAPLAGLPETALHALGIDLHRHAAYLAWYVGSGACIVAAIHLVAWLVTVVADGVRGRIEPRLQVVGASRLEGDGRPVLRFVLRLSRPSDVEVVARVRTEDRQAVGGIHYRPVADLEVRFGPGAIERDVDVVLERSSIAGVEVSDDDLRLRVTDADGATIGPPPKLGKTLVDGVSTAFGGLVVGTCLSLVEFRARAWLHGVAAHPAFGSLASDGHGLGGHARVMLAFTCLAVPVAILASLLGELAFVACTSLLPRSDEDREWLGRASGVFLACGTAWLVGTGVTLLAPLALESAWCGLDASKGATTLFGGVGALSGLVTAVLGTGEKTPATATGRWVPWRGLVLRAAALVFFANLAVALSAGMSVAIMWRPFADALQAHPGEQATRLLARIGIAIVALGLGAALVGRVVNVNRFSLHAMYRNRLIRAFLGAANQRAHRRDRFTLFNEGDNIEMHRLWDRAEPPRPGASWRPFHVVNVALNVVSSRRLAWQERKAEPFVFTPLWCGAANLDAFRRASEYAGRFKAVTLGTAMAISGAALSPNMGYHSSPLVTLLLTLFNVRLGWWFGNPRNDETYRLEGPRWAVRPLLAEALGLTTDDLPYVYLSDGGHFENLGLYEMVRRRCHLVVVSDAGHDPDCGLEDLANATRKVAIDLGVPIAFPDLRTLRPRNDDWADPARGGPGFAIGHIDYAAVDGRGARPGLVLYVKPTLRGDEPADILGYAAGNRTFPHDATTNQWFKESQFESYRSLAHATMARIQESIGKGRPAEGTPPDLVAWMAALADAHAPRRAGSAATRPPPSGRPTVDDPDGADLDLWRAPAPSVVPQVAWPDWSD